jgi:hypothetical protein
MSTELIPTAVGGQAFLEAPATVRLASVGDRVIVTFGDDLHGLRLMGDTTTVHLLIVEADRQLTHLKNEPS